jgi:murein DD-endopeptidase MepM/ murein hydrolase activator NlpD
MQVRIEGSNVRIAGEIRVEYGGGVATVQVVVPLRDVYEAMGYHVGWERKGPQSITINGYGHELTFRIGQASYDFDDFIHPANSVRGISLFEAPYISNGRSFVPLVSPLRRVGCDLKHIRAEGNTREHVLIIPMEYAFFVNTSSGVNLRNSSNEPLRVIPNGERVFVVEGVRANIEADNIWLNVTHNGLAGWVEARFLGRETVRSGKYFYTHLTAGSVPTSGRVNAGDKIGTVGSQGGISPAIPHLHFDITKSKALGGLYDYRGTMRRSNINQAYLPSFVSPHERFTEIWGAVLPK